jgi:hypothetical protein
MFTANGILKEEEAVSAVIQIYIYIVKEELNFDLKFLANYSVYIVTYQSG